MLFSFHPRFDLNVAVIIPSHTFCHVPPFYNSIKVGGNNSKQQKIIFFSLSLSFPLQLSDPCFCCVTDDFNYLLTPCTQQIHMINGLGDCCNHHLDEAEGP